MTEQARIEALAREMIQRGELNHLFNPGEGARRDREYQDDRRLRYSIRDIPTFDGKGDSLPHTHIIEFGDFLTNTGFEINYLPREPEEVDREYHRTVIKDVVSKFKATLKGKPRLWFEIQYPTPNDEPKTKEAYERMVSSFITEHNPIGSTREQQIMVWRSLNWDPAQERLDDFVYKLRRTGQELGKNADEQLDYFKYSVPPHLYLYLQDTTTIKGAMEAIRRACALGGVSVQAAPVEPRTTQSVPFMQMTERADSKIVARKDDHIKVTALKFNGMMDFLEKFIDRLSKSVARSVKIQGRKLDRDRDSKDRDRRSNIESRDNRNSRNNRDSRNSRDSRRNYRSDSDSSSEDDRQRSRSRDSSISRSRSRGRTIKTCIYCHKPNHELSHCYRFPKDLKKLDSGNLKIDGSGDKDEQARWQILIVFKNFLESQKDSTN